MTGPSLEAVLAGCAGASSDAVREFTGLPISLSRPALVRLPLSEVAGLLGGPEQETFGVRLELGSPLRGEMLIALSPGAVSALSARLVPGETPRPLRRGLPEMVRSALLELGNILSGACLSHLAARTGSRIALSVPRGAADMAAALLEGMLVEATRGRDHVEVIVCDLVLKGAPDGGRVLIVPAAGSLAELSAAVRLGALPETVRMGEIVVRSEQEAPLGLAIHGLGSCVALFVWSCRGRAGGIAHVLLAEPTESSPLTSPGAFAATAVAGLIDQLAARGCASGGLVARVVGGASMFGSGSQAHRPLGERNVEAVLSALALHAVPVAGMEVGGAHGRSLLADLGTGRVRVKGLDGLSREI